MPPGGSVFQTDRAGVLWRSGFGEGELRGGVFNDCLCATVLFDHVAPLLPETDTFRFGEFDHDLIRLSAAG